MPSDPQTHARFIGEVIKLVTGTSFIVIGLAALVVAGIRRRAAGVLAVFWLGVWSAIYGIQSVSDCSFLVALLPHGMQVCVSYLHALVTYLVLVAGLLTFRELCVGWLRQFTTLLALTALLIAVFSIGRFVLTGEEYWLLGLNSFVAAVGLLVLLIFFLVPSLGRKYTLISNRRVMLAGAIIFGLEALFTNIVRPLGYQIYAIWGDLGFFVLILSLGYVAMQQVYAGERRHRNVSCFRGTSPWGRRSRA